jgi:hypothetical protein
MLQDKRNEAMIEAAKEGDSSKCKALVAAQADVNYKDVVRAKGGGMETM